MKAKKLSIISLALALSLSIVGCTRSAERDVYKAFQQTMDIRSMESNTEVSFALEGTGLDAETQQMLDQAKATLNNSKFYIDQKQALNSERTAGKAEVELRMDIPGMKMDMGVWVDMDYTSEDPQLVEIIKMPPMLMSAYGPEAANKKYIVYDVAEVMNSLNKEGQEIDMDFSKLMNLSKDLQPKMEEFMKTYFKDFKSDKKLVTYMGKKNVDGKDLSIYNVKLDDESLKSLVRNAGNYSLDNKENVQFLKDYMGLVSSAMEMTGAEGQISKEELDKEISTIESKLPEFKKTFNEFMDSVKDVKIIGEKGIVIEYGINSDGYIVNEKGAIDFRIDLASVSKAFISQTPEGAEGVAISPTTGVINLNINYKSNIKNINKELKISLPKVDEKNSISFEKLMEVQMKQFEQMENSVETTEEAVRIK